MTPRRPNPCVRCGKPLSAAEDRRDLLYHEACFTPARDVARRDFGETMREAPRTRYVTDRPLPSAGTPKNGVTFEESGRVKVEGGRRVRAADVKEFISSNGRTIYSVTVWQDGKLSCNCPGWTFVRNGEHKCKHVVAAASGGGQRSDRSAQTLAAGDGGRGGPIRPFVEEQQPRARRLLRGEDS